MDRHPSLRGTAVKKTGSLIAPPPSRGGGGDHRTRSGSDAVEAFCVTQSASDTEALRPSAPNRRDQANLWGASSLGESAAGLYISTLTVILLAPGSKASAGLFLAFERPEVQLNAEPSRVLRDAVSDQSVDVGDAPGGDAGPELNGLRKSATLYASPPSGTADRDRP
jgi:hypothetical protein